MPTEGSVGFRMDPLRGRGLGLPSLRSREGSGVSYGSLPESVSHGVAVGQGVRGAAEPWLPGACDGGVGPRKDPWVAELALSGKVARLPGLSLVGLIIRLFCITL